MKIGFVVPGIGFAGGIERHAYDLAVALRARGHELTLLHGEAGGREPETYVRPFSQVWPLREAPRARIEVAYAHRLRGLDEARLFRDIPLGIAAHDHDFTCIRSHRYLPLSQRPCHRPPGVGCISHGCVLVRDREGRLPVKLRNPYTLRDTTRELAAEGRFIANSDYVASGLWDAGVPGERISVIHPVPPEDEEPVVPRPAAPRLAFAGQLVRGKGVDLALRALAWLPSSTTLTVAGDGPARPQLERLAHRVAPGQVRFLGYVSPMRMRAVYDEASVVVMPSRWPEPFGMVGIEALRRARPVVGADHGGIPEWLVPGHAGVRFTPGSPRSLAMGIQSMLADLEVGERALAHARREFRHGDMVDRIECVLGELRSTAPHL